MDISGERRIVYNWSEFVKNHKIYLFKVFLVWIWESVLWARHEKRPKLSANQNWLKQNFHIFQCYVKSRSTTIDKDDVSWPWVGYLI